MPRKKRIQNQKTHLNLRRLLKFVKLWASKSVWRKITLLLLALVFLVLGTMYGIAQWYIAKHADEPLEIGATFIPKYARYFDLDDKETLKALIDDLGIRRFRLVSYWDSIEQNEGTYDFSELDWQFDMVEEAGGTVSLAIGLRQPRWPECHEPDWVRYKAESEWEQDLNRFISEVVNRYKDRPSLVSYQLENEYFLEVFGVCPNFKRERLVNEFNLVKSIDPDKPLIVTRSNNATPSWPVGEPRADIIGASIYKRVWDRSVTKRYFEYPFPAWFYAFLAGGAEITTGRNTFIHEMQTEAWPPYSLKDAPIAEQDKSLSADKLRARIKYGLDTGMRTIDLWGVEWWYWRKVKMNDPSLWNEGKRAIYDLQTTGRLD